MTKLHIYTQSTNRVRYQSSSLWSKPPDSLEDIHGILSIQSLDTQTQAQKHSCAAITIATMTENSKIINLNILKDADVVVILLLVIIIIIIVIITIITIIIPFLLTRKRPSPWSRFAIVSTDRPQRRTRM